MFLIFDIFPSPSALSWYLVCPIFFCRSLLQMDFAALQRELTLTSTPSSHDCQVQVPSSPPSSSSSPSSAASPSLAEDEFTLTLLQTLLAVKCSNSSAMFLAKAGKGGTKGGKADVESFPKNVQAKALSELWIMFLQRYSSCLGMPCVGCF